MTVLNDGIENLAFKMDGGTDLKMGRKKKKLNKCCHEDLFREMELELIVSTELNLFNKRRVIIMGKIFIEMNKVKQYQSLLIKHMKQNPNLGSKYWNKRAELIHNLIREESINKYTPPPYKDVTQEWLDEIDHSKVGKITESDYFEMSGVPYDSSNSYLEHSFDKNEEETVTWLANYLHENIRKIPRTAPYDNEKKFIKTPDIILKDDYWEIKIPIGNSKSTIRNRVADAKGQANNFIIDIKNSKMVEEDALIYVQALFSQYNTNFIDYVMLVNGKKLITILKKR